MVVVVRLTMVVVGRRRKQRVLIWLHRSFRCYSMWGKCRFWHKLVAFSVRWYINVDRVAYVMKLSDGRLMVVVRLRMVQLRMVHLMVVRLRTPWEMC